MSNEKIGPWLFSGFIIHVYIYIGFITGGFFFTSHGFERFWISTS